MDIELPPYRPPVWLRNGHVQSVLPTLFRRVDGVVYRRARIDLADGDFLDLDWCGEGRERVALIAHGLEGSSDRAYVRGMTRALVARGWTVCAWNMRGCSGEPNRTVGAYHSGSSPDLDAVVAHALRLGADRIALVGFSLGGNVTLKWLGEQNDDVDARVVGAVAISVPIDLASSSAVMEHWSRRIYMRRFLRSLEEKVAEKAGAYPEAPDPAPVRTMTTFREFDGYFTAPVHGFADAEDYWRCASSRPLLRAIRVPTLLVQALDDPFLAPTCYPTNAADDTPDLTLLTPAHGGHVGFIERGGEFWSETVAGRFLDRALDQAESSSASRVAPSSTA